MRKGSPKRHHFVLRNETHNPKPRRLAFIRVSARNEIDIVEDVGAQENPCFARDANLSEEIFRSTFDNK
jgi:hypothetical protein